MKKIKHNGFFFNYDFNIDKKIKKMIMTLSHDFDVGLFLHYEKEITY